MTRSSTEFEAVLALIHKGRNDCVISRATAIPRSTVRDWRHGLASQTVRGPDASGGVCSASHNFSDLPTAPYSYLLGLYLGDGGASRYTLEESRVIA